MTAGIRRGAGPPRRVVVGVSGSIAAYKAALLVRLLRKSGVHVQCILTRAATEFITPVTMATLSEHPVTVDLFGPQVGATSAYEHEPEWEGWAAPEERGAPTDSGGETAEADRGGAREARGRDLSHEAGIAHIRATRSADLIVVAPATANVLAKVAAGVADDALSTTILASSVPVVFAPAMNTRMWEHPATRANVEKLRRWGYLFLDPGAGDLASGDVGAGRMAEPHEIADLVIRTIDAARDVPTLLVTTGGTEEPIDPVRSLSNRSSGRMGFAVAEAGRDLGLRVTVVAGRTTAPEPYGMEIVRVGTAAEMAREVSRRHADHDVLIMAAAIADYRPKSVAKSKIRSGKASISLGLVPTADVLSSVAAKRHAAGRVTVGFALETEATQSARVEAARRKLARKGADLLVLNDPTRKGSEFGGATNQVTFLHRDGTREDLPRMGKVEVGREIVARALRLLEGER